MNHEKVAREIAAALIKRGLAIPGTRLTDIIEHTLKVSTRQLATTK